MLLHLALEPPKKKPHLENDGTSNTEKKEVKEDQEDDYIENEKVVMVEKVKDHFEVLPDGWVTLTHNSGMPLYLHRTSRVCTLSKPYFLGPGSARKHDIPLSAVPCLEYRRAKEEEDKKKEDNQQTLVVNGKVKLLVFSNHELFLICQLIKEFSVKGLKFLVPELRLCKKMNKVDS